MTDLIQTRRLLLRPLTLDDADPFARLMTPAIARWTGSWKGEATARDVAERIERALVRNREGLSYDRAMVRLADGALIGWLAGRKNAAKDRLGSIGYWTGEAFHGQGYTKEAAHALLPRLWDVLDVDVIEGAVQTPNLASLAVLRGLGMRHVGQRLEFASARGRADLCDCFQIDRPPQRPPVLP